MSNRRNRQNLWIAFAVLFAASYSFAGEGTFNRNLTVNGTADIEIMTTSGNLDVHSGPVNQVTVVGHVKPANKWNLFGGGGDPQQRIDRIVNKPPIEQNGNWIRIGKMEESLLDGISISYDVTVPKDIRLRANTGSGDVRIDDVAGGTVVRSGSGNLKLHNLGSDLEVKSGSGDIDAIDVAGTTRVSTGSGNIHIQQSGTGYVRTSTGSGDVTIDNAKGEVEASTGSGNIHASGSVLDNWNIHTGSGDVRIQVPHDAKFTIHARSNSGSVHSDLPVTMQGSLERHTVHGTVNGGGPTLEIHTGSGNIDLH